MRDLKEKPYSPDEARVAKWFACKVGIGGGDDPIGSLIAHQEYVAAERKHLLAENARLWRFVDFVNLWCNRTTKVSDSERLSCIKYHPTAQQRLKQVPIETPKKEDAA